MRRLMYALQIDGERGVEDGRRTARHAPSLGAQRRSQHEGNEIRMWYRAMRCLHGTHRRASPKGLPDTNLDGQRTCYDHRRFVARRIASAAESLVGTRCTAMRILPGRTTHV